MRNPFLLLFCTLFAFAVGAVENKCPFNLRIDYQDGAKGCLTDLPLSKKIVKNWGKPLLEIVNGNRLYSVAASLTCQDIYVSTGYASLSGLIGKDLRTQAALRLCDKACDCQIVLADGSSSVKKEALMAFPSQDHAVQNAQAPSNMTSPRIASVAIPNNSNDEDSAQNSSRLNQQAIESQKKAIENQRKELDARAEILNSQLRNEEDLRQREKALQDRELSLRETQKLIEEAKLKEELLRLQQDKKSKETVAAEITQGSDRELLLSLAAEFAKLKAATEKVNSTKVEQLLPLIETPIVQAPSVYANRKALIIGNDSYKSVQPLLNAREDAKSMADSLKKAGYQITLLLDQDERSFKSAIRTFRSRIEPGDEVALFFAGHGVQLGNVNYLIPLDVAGESEDQLRDEAIPLQRLLDDMADRKAKFTLAMIDACRDNPFKSNGRTIGGGTRGLAPTTAATGQMIVFSAGTGQQALDRLGTSDKNKNGVFTRVFVKEMLKPNLTVDRLIRNVRNEVVEMAKSVGHEQVPAIYDQTIGEFYLMKQ